MTSNKIKILVVYHAFPYYRLPIMRELAHDEDIQYTYLSGEPFEASIPIVRFENFGELFRWKTVKNNWIFNRKFLWQSGLINECIFGKYNCIIFLGNPYFLSTWVAAVLSRLFGRRVYFWTHATVRNKFRDVLKVFFYHLADGLLLYGNKAKYNLLRLGFDSSHVFVIYNSLDYDKQIDCRKRMNIENLTQKRREIFLCPDYPILFFIGRLTKPKRLEYLIFAGAELHKRGMPVNILFIGDGVEKEELIHLTQQNNLNEYVRFYGASYDEYELSSLIAMADLCVSPGDIGLTALHSLVYGTPVITHDNYFMQGPEYEAIEVGVTGMLYEYGSLESLVDTIHDWLKKNYENRNKIRSKCYEIVDKYYNPVYQASAIKSAICKVLGMRNNGRFN